MRPRDTKRLFWFPSRSRRELRADIDEEFRFHVDMRADALMQAGVPAGEARDRALREFGDRETGAARCAAQGDRIERHRRIARVFADLRQDASVAWRQLARSPGFAAAAILMLGLGVGATVAIFSALDPVLLRPLPYPGADRLVCVVETGDSGLPNSVSGGAFLDWQTHQTQFDSLTLTAPVTANLRGRSATEHLIGLEVSHDFLRVFGLRPLLGTGFRPEHDRAGGTNDVVIITEELWRSRFGAEPSIVGTRIVLDEVPKTVVGVLPAGAWIFREAQYFVPAVLPPGASRSQRSPHWAAVYGRLKGDTTVARADAELKMVKQQLAAEYPPFKRKWSVRLLPLREVLADDRRAVLLTLLGAVALVLLIACANVANLLLGRACERQQEMALRCALGATGGRLVRQVLTEAALLAALGGGIGIVLASWSVRVLARLTSDMFPQVMTPQLDGRVLAFAVVVSSLTALLFGLLPAWRSARPDVNDALKNGGKSATTGGQRRTQSLLVVAEVAFTVVLLAGAGLLLRSLSNTASVDPGFEPARVLAFDLSLPVATYPSAKERLAFSNELLDRLRTLPGVEAGGTGMAIPASGGGYGEYLSRPAQKAEGDFHLGRVDFVSDGYLEALGTRLLAGRRFNSLDNRPDGHRVAVVNAAAARVLFPGQNAVGAEMATIGQRWEIIGVVADVLDRRLDIEPRPFAYLPQAYNPNSFSMVLRTSVAPLSVAASVREQLTKLGPGVALANMRTLDENVAQSMAQQRLALTLIGTFAGAALVLACIGLYGVMAYSVATRRRELSIRMALGAVASRLVRDIMSDGLRLTAIGVCIGLVGAFGAGRILASQLYKVGSADPLIVGGTILTMGLIGVVACFLPAWSAARSNPIAALRNG
jgi:predicted permease